MYKRQVRRDAVINCREIALLCKKHGVRVIVNTDSHFATQVGHAGLALKMLDDIGFPEELVVNSSVERFRQYLKERNIPVSYTHLHYLSADRRGFSGDIWNLGAGGSDPGRRSGRRSRHGAGRADSGGSLPAAKRVRE